MPKIVTIQVALPAALFVLDMGVAACTAAPVDPLTNTRPCMDFWEWALQPHAATPTPNTFYELPQAVRMQQNIHMALIPNYIAKQEGTVGMKSPTVPSCLA